MSPQTAKGATSRRTIGVRIARAAMDRLGQWDGSQAAGRLPLRHVGKVLGAAVAVAIAVAGWFVMAILVISGAMAIVGVAIVPVVTGGLAAAVGRQPKFRWPFLGFALPPILALVSVQRPPPSGESSGYEGAVVMASLVGLVTLGLGFYGWLRIRRRRRHIDRSRHDASAR